jgi:hypothetical protein
MNTAGLIWGWVKKHKIIIWVIIVFMLSLSMRFYNIENRMWWGNDTGREILVGYHIGHYHEFPTLGTSASDLATYSYYPPYYYYLVGLVASFAPSAPSIIKTFIFFESFLPVVIFFIGLFISNFPSAVFASFFIAISSYMVSVTNLWPPFVALLFFYFGLAILVFGKKRSFLFRIIGQAVMFFSATLHYSFFIPSIVLFFWNLSQENTRKDKFVFFGIQTGYFILLVSPLWINSGGSRVFQAFDPRYVFDFYQPVSIFIETLKNIYGELFQNNSLYGLLSAGICIFLLIFSFKNVLSFLKTNWWMWCIILSMPFIGSRFVQHPELYEYIAIMPMGLLLVACSPIRTEKLTLQNIVRGALLCCLVFSLSNNFSELFTNGWNSYKQNEKLTDYIVAEAKSRGLENNFRLFVSDSTGSFDWASPNFWYFLETKYHRKIAYVVNYDISLEQLIAPGADTYLVCRGTSDTIALCKSHFHSSFPEYTKELTLKSNEGYVIFLYSTAEYPH